MKDTIFVVALVSAGLSFAAGFCGGAVLNRPSRQNYDSKIEKIRTESEQSEQAIKEKLRNAQAVVQRLEKEVRYLNNELRNMTTALGEANRKVREKEAGQTTATQAEPVAYEIVESEDQSRKAITKSLSSYTHQELVSLPIDKRMEYKVVVSPDIKENQVKPTIDKIITDITSKDNDIDEISLFLYSDKELANEMYDVARATWAPGGRLGNITPEIARSNDRTDYKITIQIVRNLEQYLQQRAKSEQKFGFTEAERRRIFKEIVAVEDKAQAEADRKYPISGRTVWGLSKSELRSQIDKNIDLMRHLEKQYKKELSKKYGLIQEQLKKISLEGVVEMWPMPKLKVNSLRPLS